MATAPLANHVRTDNSRIGPRIGGTAAMVGAALAIVGNSVILGAAPGTSAGTVSFPLSPDAFRLGQVFFAATQLAMGAGIVALARSGAAGRSRLGTAGGWLAIAGWAITVLGEAALAFVAELPVDSDGANTVTAIYGIGVLLADAGLIAFGIAALRARRWTTWRRWLPLALGMFQLVIVTPVVLAAGFASIAAYIAVVAQDLLVAALGYALVTGSRIPAV